MSSRYVLLGSLSSLIESWLKQLPSILASPVELTSHILTSIGRAAVSKAFKLTAM